MSSSSRPSPGSYVVDPADPRAPSTTIWKALSPEEQRRILSELPADVPWSLHPPEGDAHRRPKEGVVDALGRFFRRAGRQVYISSEIATYYPDEPRFCPDVLAVLDVADHERDRWMVDAEGKGLDFVLEVHVAGDRQKDFVRNVQRYARLGIPEYFIFDRTALRLIGHRLAEDGARYVRIVPQVGRYTSRVLGLDLTVDSGRIRFLNGDAIVLDTSELVGRLEHVVDDLIASREELTRYAEEQGRIAKEQARIAEEQARIAEERIRIADGERQRAEAEHARANRGEAEAERLRARLRALGVDPDET